MVNALLSPHALPVVLLLLFIRWGKNEQKIKAPAKKQKEEEGKAL
jgi:hypothetical protein